MSDSNHRYEKRGRLWSAGKIHKDNMRLRLQKRVTAIAGIRLHHVAPSDTCCGQQGIQRRGVRGA
ncbi:expressed unknown protein [Ectocarpus siliculosus]|uniref:Uncharacterized protein n=1 Tax=Ectocarpus siliculosus TaxID=2880 RepID=D7G6E7_ECTSI|nr:expressed unknown protein [Ectocarpus siliculosus]|eukprot:CBJ27542.1 expressed unknown protein [Ectocarpus siliculosus]